MENIVLYDRINSLPRHVKEEVLDFMEFLLEKNKKQGTDKKTINKSTGLPERKLGLLETKASVAIKENFKMTDEELLSG